MANVTIIPATKDKFTALPITSVKKRRVAGYARVSTDSEEQLTSYDAQVDYYTNFIKANPEWEFAGVYTDEGISATNTKKREGFNRMINDALAGKIDLIVTKSVSRFARNTVDSLTTIRKLKAVGCECYFQKENIYTFDGKGELLLTIMSSLAQEESRSISENVTWGQRKRFADGKVSMPYKKFLGYIKGEDNQPKVEEKEAEIVRLIYRLFLEGKTTFGICAYLENMNIPTPTGKAKWRQSTIQSILTNEKYKGDALLQKTFTTDFLEKKKKINEGEVPQYYVENSHQAIIPPEEWDMVQEELERRNTVGRHYSGNGIFASKLICGECGGFYGHKVWHSTSQYRKDIWRCNAKFEKKTMCDTPTLDEEEIKQKFMQAYNMLMTDMDSIIEACEFIRTELTDCSEIDAKIEKLNEEINDISELVKSCIRENASTVQSQNEYKKRYNSLVSRYESAKSQLETLTAKKKDRQNRSRKLKQFIKDLVKQQKVMTEWNDTPWLMLLEQATVFNDGIVFKFKDGTEIKI